jgi:hypothetical protein
VTPALLLNHFYVTPDAATFEALERSPFLSRFGVLEKRTTVRKDATYTGLYLYGERTYLEFLHPDSTSFGAPTGVAYGVEQSGALDQVAMSVPAPVLALISRGEIPWFRWCRSQRPLEGLAEWVMEYVPAFFLGFHPELPPERPGIARADALTRYVAACGKLRERGEGLFEDVVALEIALTRNDVERWEARSLRTEGVELHVASVPRGSPAGILAARLRLRRDAGKSVERIGSTTLSLDGNSAVWRFERGVHGHVS